MNNEKFIEFKFSSARCCVKYIFKIVIIIYGSASDLLICFAKENTPKGSRSRIDNATVRVNPLTGLIYSGISEIIQIVISICIRRNVNRLSLVLIPLCRNTGQSQIELIIIAIGNTKIYTAYIIGNIIVFFIICIEQFTINRIDMPQITSVIRLLYIKIYGFHRIVQALQGAFGGIVVAEICTVAREFVFFVYRISLYSACVFHLKLGYGIRTLSLVLPCVFRCYEVRRIGVRKLKLVYEVVVGLVEIFKGHFIRSAVVGFAVSYKNVDRVYVVKYRDRFSRGVIYVKVQSVIFCKVRLFRICVFHKAYYLTVTRDLLMIL